MKQTKIKANTIKGIKFLQSYERSIYRTIRECYVSPSRAKIYAELECYNKMVKQRGFDFRILSYNIYHFTCGWLTENENGVQTLHVETASNSYIIVLE